jgi:hypothetical protein
VQPNNYPSWRDKENLVDYEPEEPATFPLQKKIIIAMETNTRPTEIGRKTILRILMNFPAYPAEGADRVGGKRSQSFFRRGSAAARRAGVLT